jgi:hypothetical protein
MATTKPSGLVLAYAGKVEEAVQADIKLQMSGGAVVASLEERLEIRVDALHAAITRRSGVADATVQLGSLLALMHHVGDEVAAPRQLPIPGTEKPGEVVAAPPSNVVGLPNSGAIPLAKWVGEETHRYKVRGHLLKADEEIAHSVEDAVLDANDAGVGFPAQTIVEVFSVVGQDVNQPDGYALADTTLVLTRDEVQAFIDDDAASNEDELDSDHLEKEDFDLPPVEMGEEKKKPRGSPKAKVKA